MTLSESQSGTTEAMPRGRDHYILCHPTAEDGQAFWQLIDACPRLAGNPLCRNALRRNPFADTCVFAPGEGVPTERADWLERDRHFCGQHESGILITTGPFEGTFA